MKKIVIGILLVSGLELHAISSVMNHRLVTSSPLLYKQIDYAQEQLSIEFEPWVAGSFDPAHTIANLTPQGQMTLSLNEQGNGDINSGWLYLQSLGQDYMSTITLTPTQQLYGGLFHCYKQFEHLFFDVRTSLLQSKSMVSLTEAGGGNGVLATPTGQPVYNAAGAFTQNDYQYGKIGVSHQMIGFDNIQIMLGASTRDVSEMLGSSSKSYVAGFAVIEVPTGAGTTAQWLFEPQIGTNHWGVGFGVDLMLVSDNNFSFVFGGNFRHLIGNWETRTFDLTENGPWSRYLLVESLATLGGGPNLGTPAINILTQDAVIEGRNQITMYGRLQRKFESSLFELSYNLFYNQAETINTIKSIPSGYGIYAINTSGGVTTSSSATINEIPTVAQEDFPPVELVTSDLNLASGAAGQWLSNTVAARLQRIQEFYTYGVGASVDLASTAQAISSWSVWVNFEILLP